MCYFQQSDYEARGGMGRERVTYAFLLELVRNLVDQHKGYSRQGASEDHWAFKRITAKHNIQIQGSIVNETTLFAPVADQFMWSDKYITHVRCTPSHVNKTLNTLLWSAIMFCVREWCGKKRFAR